MFFGVVVVLEWSRFEGETAHDLYLVLLLIVAATQAVLDIRDLRRLNLNQRFLVGLVVFSFY